MRTVPVTAAAVLLADHHGVREQLRWCGVAVGDRVEIDLDRAADAVGPDVAAALETYLRRSRVVWEAASRGRSGVEYVLVRRTVAQHQQVTGKVGRADLVAVYEALSELPGVGDVLDEVTAAAPDLDVLSAMVTSLAGTVSTPEPGSTLLTIGLEGQYAFHDVLGGPPWPGEVRRTITLLTRQAGWRDRRVRRLARVDVTTAELWADPVGLLPAEPTAPDPSDIPITDAQNSLPGGPRPSLPQPQVSAQVSSQGPTRPLTADPSVLPEGAALTTPRPGRSR